MRCANVGLLLGEYADGRADERSRRIVERHIQLCQTCRNAVLITHQLGQQLLRLPLLPLGVVDRVPSIRRRMEQHMQGGRRFTIHPMAARLVYLLVIIALSALLWLLVTSWLALQ